MPKPIPLILILFGMSCGSMQASKDSLRSVIYGSSSMADRMKALSAISFIYHVNNPDSAIHFAQQCIEMSNRYKESAERASCLNALGLAYYRKGFYKLAQSSFEQALRYYEKAKEYEQAARVNINISQVYSIQKDFYNAQKYIMKSLRYYETNKDSFRLAATYQTMAVISREIKDFDKAIHYINRSINIYKGLNKQNDWANSITIRGNIYRVQKKLDESIKDYMQALAAYHSARDISGAAIAYENMGISYFDKKNYEMSITQFQKAIQLFEQLGSETDVAYESLKLAAPLTQLKRFDEALKLLRVAETYFAQNTLMNYLLEAYEQYYHTYKSMNRISDALLYYEKYNWLKDSLSQVQNKDEMLRIQMNYEAEKKENEIALLKAFQAKQSAEIRFRSLALYALIGLFVTGILFFIFWRRKLALSQELKKQTMLAQIASDLHDDIGASLSAIKMLGEIIQKKSEFAQLDIAPLAKKIAGNSEEIIHAMSDIVWAIKPENNDIKALYDKLFQTAVDCCSSKNISLKFAELSNGLSTKNLDVEIKKDIYLMTKEAIHNAAKYSQASTLEVAMWLDKDLLKISVKDDGKGFREDWVLGNGIKNMKARCAKHNGDVQIISHEKGVEVCFSIPLPN